MFLMCREISSLYLVTRNLSMALVKRDMALLSTLVAISVAVRTGGGLAEINCLNQINYVVVTFRCCYVQSIQTFSIIYITKMSIRH